MKNVKKLIAVGTMITLVGATSLTAFAASDFATPAEVLASLTGKTVEAVVAEKVETEKTYGTLASEAGELDQFKAEVLELKKNQLAERVAAGTMTKERADEITAIMLENQENCDGTGTGNDGVRLGAGFGQGFGQGSGQGSGQSSGNMQGNGGGAGFGGGEGAGAGAGQGNMNRGFGGAGNCIQAQ